jgi:hypothetical protein
MAWLPRRRHPQQQELLLLLCLSVALLLCSCSWSRYCSALALIRAAAPLFLSLTLLLRALLLLLDELLLRHLSARAFLARAATDLYHCFSATSARA